MSKNLNYIQVKPSNVAPSWWLVFLRELNELWMGGKAPILLLLFCVLLGSTSYVQTIISQDDPIPPKEMLFYVLGSSIGFGLLIGMIIGADSISGERERSTLESLLLTPTSRRQIVVGKFLAAISPWPVALVMTVPYLTVLAQRDEMLGPAVFWGAVLGSLLTSSFVALGMLVSFWSNSNKTSLSVSLTLYIIFYLPTQLPSGAQKGAMGYLLKRVNPMESVNQFLENVLVNNRTPTYMAPWLRSPILFGVLVFGLLFWYAGSLGLEGRKAS